MDGAEADVLALTAFPKAHQRRIHSTDQVGKGVVRNMIFPTRVTAGQSAAHRLQMLPRSQLTQFASTRPRLTTAAQYVERSLGDCSRSYRLNYHVSPHTSFLFRHGAYRL
jgi:hypothetical protein